MESSKLIPHNATTALITGGSSGIGREFAQQLARKGVNLVIVSNQDDELKVVREELVAEFDIKVDTIFIDLTSENAPKIIEQYCDDKDIRVDILINNAGIFSFCEMLSMQAERINLFVDLHMRVVTQLCYIFGKKMKNRGNGYILNMSSMSCWMPMAGISMYSATKAYIRVLSRSLYLELKESGVHVMVACPGGIATNLFGLSPRLQRLGIKLGVLATPQSFVAGALNATFRKRKQYINGLINRVAIFVVAILPTPIKLIVKHKFLDNAK